jgi:hypothetical protein
MLVPAMAFSWWLVSMPAPASHTGMASGDGLAESATQTNPQDGEEAPSPAGDPATAVDKEADDDTTGERVPVKLVTPEIVRAAKSFLDLPMGAERAARLSGRRYVFVLERHYHPPGFVGGPHGWHKGVTVYEVKQ